MRILHTMLCLALWLCGLPPAAAMAQNEAAESETSGVDLLDVMYRRAGEVRVATRDDTAPRPLREAALFRYSDVRRDILDAALWGYGGTGRPAALMKTEVYSSDSGQKWVYCITSLSSGLLQADWTDGARFRAKEPGVTFRAIPNAPAAGKSASLRLLQMKRLTDRFSAVIQNGEEDREPMRLLPTPICRYDDEESGLIDGAIFGFTMGTNPDVLLVIELIETEAGELEWQCGAACMTSAGFVVRLDNQEILKQDFVRSVAGQPQAFDRWMWHRIIEPQ